MDIFERFKKDYFNYLVSFILPALVTGLSIPVFKRMLGAANYGHFSIWFNAILICSAILVGWINNSVLRFYSGSLNKPLFIKQVFLISFYTHLFVFIPASIVVWYMTGSLLLALFFSLALVSISIQFTIAAICQAAFLSRKIMMMETIRVGSYVGVAICLLHFTQINYLYVLFGSSTLAYLLSALYLYRQAYEHLSVSKLQSHEFQVNLSKAVSKFFRYGVPFSFWFVFSYLLSYIDKLFMSHNMGHTVQGNYQAIFDLISRGITILIYPVVTSLFPILTVAYESGNISGIRKILRKIIFYELVGLLATLLIYWCCGAEILLSLLKTPATLLYKWTGAIVIAATFIWQIAIVVQKKLELKMMSLQMLLMVIVAFIAQLLFYVFLGKSQQQLVYPFGYLVAAIVYLFLVSFSDIVSFFGRKPNSLSGK